MRKIAVILGLLAGALRPQAQNIPATLNYQGRLTDNSPAQAPLSGPVQMQFAIYDAVSGGTRLWQEPAADNTGVAVTVTGGLFNVVLGGSVAIPASVFTGATSTRYLQITLDPAANAETLAPRQLITATGYASLAENANTAANAASAGFATAALALSADGADCPPGSYPLGVSASGAAQGCTPAGTGTVTAVTATAPLSVVNGSTAPVITLQSPLPVAHGGTGNTSGNAVSATALAANGANCPAGQIPRGVDAAGNAEGCTPGLESAPYFSRATVDAAGDVGSWSAIAVGRDGLGLISYRDYTNHDLKVAHCGDVACSRATLTAFDAAGDAMLTSIAIGADGLGLISYMDETSGELKAAHCADAACSSATFATLDAAGPVSLGNFTSIAIGGDGLGLISYVDGANGDLKVAHCADVACSSAALATLDAAGSVGYYSSITIGADGLGLISYFDFTNGDLKVAHCADVACSGAALATLDAAGSTGYFTSITLGGDGRGLVSYYDGSNGDLKAAHCADAACSGATLATLDTAGTVGYYTSIMRGRDGLGLIGYIDYSGALKTAHCADAACSGAALATLDPAGIFYYGASIARGGDGLGLISYFEITGLDLRVVHCGTPDCMPQSLALGGTGADLTATGGASPVHYLKQAGVGAAVTVGPIDAADIPDLDAAKITSGIFTGNGSGLTNLPPMSLPYSGGIATSGGASAAFSVTNTGTGMAGTFSQSNGASVANALSATANGSGDALAATNNGSAGRAGVFQINNSASTAAALHASTNGGGSALSATTSGTGSAGYFSSTSSAAGNQPTLVAWQYGLGSAAFFQAQNAASTAPALQVGNAGTGPAVIAYADNPAGIPLVAQGATGQTASLQEWRNGAGAALASVTATGQVKLTGGAPGAGKVLTSDAAGLGSWTALPAGNPGTVTSVTAGAPLSVVNGSTTPAISLSGVVPVANGGTGSAVKNFVDLSTSQSVGGSKSFTGPVSVAGSLSIGVRYVGCPITMAYQDCACAAGETVLSGGASAGLGWVGESRPVSATTWRVGCFTSGGALKNCDFMNIICARLAP